MEQLHEFQYQTQQRLRLLLYPNYLLVIVSFGLEVVKEAASRTLRLQLSMDYLLT